MKTSSHWRHKYNKEKQWTGHILVHIDPHIYINLHIKYGSNLIRTFRVKIKNMKTKIKFHFFRVMLGPSIKSRGADFITVETYVGGLQWSNLAYLAFQLSSHPYLCTCEIRKQSDKNVLSLNPKYDTNIIFSYLGGPVGPLCRTQGYQIFRAVILHHRADKCITRDTNNHQCFIYGPNAKKCEILTIRGGGGGLGAHK